MQLFFCKIDKKEIYLFKNKKEEIIYKFYFFKSKKPILTPINKTIVNIF